MSADERPSAGERKNVEPDDGRRLEARVVVVLLANVGLALVAVGIASWTSDLPTGVRASVVALAAVESLATLLAVRLAFGGAAWLALAPLVALVSLCCLGPLALVILWGASSLVVTTVLGTAARREGVGWVFDDDSAPRIRHSIGELLFATVVCAVLLALIRTTQLTPVVAWFERRENYSERWRSLPIVVMLPLSFVPEALLPTISRVSAVVAVAGSRPSAWGVPLALGCGYLCGLAAWFRPFPAGPGMWEPHSGAASGLLGVALAMASLLAIRAAGWRIDRLPRERPPRVAEPE